MTNLETGSLKPSGLKSKAVANVWQSSWSTLVFGVFFIIWPSAAFSESVQPACQPQQLEKGLPSLSHPLRALSLDVLEVFNKYQPERFDALLHPRLKRRQGLGHRLLVPLKGRYTRPWQVSIYKLWSLDNKALDKSPIACHEVSITPLYGYAQQYGLWLQIMAQNDLARVYLHVISHASKGLPAKNAWRIAGVHLQQWSYLGKDYEYWVREAVKYQKTSPLQAYLRFDIAQKMLFGGDFLDFYDKEAILNQASHIMPENQLLSQANTDTASSAIVHIGTALAQDGLSLVVRERVKVLLAMAEVKKRCRELLQGFLKAKWLDPKTSGGLKCEFILPGESELKEGKMGSLFIGSREI